MNPCTSRQKRAESTVHSLYIIDRSVEKLSLGPLPDDKNCTERTMAVDKLRLHKITHLIANEKWRELDSFLSSTDDAGVITSQISDDAIGEDFVSPMHIVHYCCRFNPPRAIVRRLTSLYPEGVKVPDKIGRLPLHHAAKWGSSHRLIKFLIELDPSAVSVKDSQGKTPIHYLCLHFVDAFRPGHFETNVEECMVQAIEAFLEADLSIVSIEDELDYTALEYAIESNAPYRVVRRLQKATERYWKEKQKTSTTMPSNVHALNEASQGNDAFHTPDMVHQTLNPPTIASSNDEKADDHVRTANKPTPLPLTKKSSGRTKYAMTA
ncbi:hypothetical protein ACHAWO_004405 [Cyclotella atomus]|uniref:Uncharacterized protein n=1 Tax=Cyclotella atomus TaxID=382360 RepID=A0ABD3P116_9STRA